MASYINIIEKYYTNSTIEGIDFNFCVVIIVFTAILYQEIIEFGTIVGTAWLK